MTDEREYLETLEPLTNDNIYKILGLFKVKYGFITDEADLGIDETDISIFIVPISQIDFRYATQEEYNYWRTPDLDEPITGLALFAKEYFDFILGKVCFTEELNGLIEL